MSYERESMSIEVPVDEVILLEDRAHVIRRGSVEVRAGATRLVIAAVAPVLADRTLCAALRGPKGEATAAARIGDVRIRRRRVTCTEDQPEQRRAREHALRALGDRKWALEVRRRRVDQALTELGSRASATIGDLAVDAGWGQVDGAAWSAALAAIHAAEEDARAERLALSEEIGDVEAEIKRLEAEIAATRETRDEIVAELIVEIEAAAAGRYALQIDYLVPGACWRPYHRATLRALAGGGSELRFACEGCVWQATGERWDDVLLTFSTERPSLGSAPPRLASEVLAVQRRSEALAVELRDQEIQTAGLGGQGRAAQRLPGIDDGGEALLLRSPARARIPSDGRPYRVPLFEVTAPASEERVLMAELDPAVILKSTQVNTGQQPILAGPVDLVRGGGFVGRTSVLFIAPGERFSLGWGPDSALRAIRTVEQSVEEKAALSSWTSVTSTVKIRLSNLGAEARTIKVIERVPVSEVEKVKIEVERLKPDAEGMIRWEVALGGMGRQTIELRWTLRKHGDVSGL